MLSIGGEIPQKQFFLFFKVIVKRLPSIKETSGNMEKVINDLLFSALVLCRSKVFQGRNPYGCYLHLKRSGNTIVLWPVISHSPSVCSVVTKVQVSVGEMTCYQTLNTFCDPSTAKRQALYFNLTKPLNICCKNLSRNNCKKKKM